MPSYYSDGLPPDLSAQLTAVRIRARLAFDDARTRQPQARHRDLLIELLIKPEVIAFGKIACELALRGWLNIDAIERAVDEHRQTLARHECPDAHTHSAWDESFQREVRERIHESEQWRQHLATVLHLAEQADKVGISRNSAPDHANKEVQPRSWKDVEIRVLSDHRIQIYVAGRAGDVLTFQEMGFGDGRRKGDTPIKAWEMLLGFADESFPRGGNTRTEKTIQTIRQRLRKLVTIRTDDDPLPLRSGCYQPAFKIVRSRAHRLDAE
jgi:hypothetical protein